MSTVLARCCAVLLAWLAFVLPGQSQVAAGSNAERALAAYRSGSYELAHELWRLELESGERAAIGPVAALHNLGNASFRLRKPLEAAAWYTAALRLAPRDESLWHNLEFVRREAGLDPADRGDLSATARRFASSLTLPEAERAVLALLAALALALAWEALRGGSAARASSLALLALLGLALVPWAWQLRHAGHDTLFVVQPEGAPLLSEPRGEATLVSRLSPASEVERTDSLPGWWRVRTAEGATGWIADTGAIALRAPWR